VKPFSLRLVAVVWLMAALSLVGWLIVNLDRGLDPRSHHDGAHDL